MTDQPFGSWTDCLIVGLSLELSSYLIKSNPVAQVKVKQKKKMEDWNVRKILVGLVNDAFEILIEEQEDSYTNLSMSNLGTPFQSLPQYLIYVTFFLPLSE